MFLKAGNVLVWSFDPEYCVSTFYDTKIQESTRKRNKETVSTVVYSANDKVIE